MRAWALSPKHSGLREGDEVNIDGGVYDGGVYRERSMRWHRIADATSAGCLSSEMAERI